MNEKYKEFVTERINAIQDPKIRKYISELIITDLDAGWAYEMHEIAEYDIYHAIEDGYPKEVPNTIGQVAGFDEFIKQYNDELQRILPGASMYVDGDEEIRLRISYNPFPSGKQENQDIAKDLSRYLESYYEKTLGETDYIFENRYIRFDIDTYDEYIAIASIYDEEFFWDAFEIADQYNIDISDKDESAVQNYIYEICMDKINIEAALNALKQYAISKHYNVDISIDDKRRQSVKYFVVKFK